MALLEREKCQNHSQNSTSLCFLKEATAVKAIVTSILPTVLLFHCKNNSFPLPLLFWKGETSVRHVSLGCHIFASKSNGLRPDVELKGSCLRSQLMHNVEERGLLSQDMWEQGEKMLKFNHSAPLPGEQSNPTSSIYSSAFFSFSLFNFHIPYTLKVFVVFLTKLRFVVIKNEPLCLSICIYTIFMDWQSFHILIYHTNWTGTSFTEMDLSALLDKSPHNTDCSALCTSKRSQSWTIRLSQMESVANTDSRTLVAGLNNSYYLKQTTGRNRMICEAVRQAEVIA